MLVSSSALVRHAEVSSYMLYGCIVDACMEDIYTLKVTEKTFQEMYINVGMANCEKRPKQERDDIRFTHIAIPTSF